MHQIALYLRLGVRLLARSRGFAVTAALVIALGIGVNTAIFSIINAVLLQPLGYPRADDVLAVWEFERVLKHIPASGPDFLAWREQNSAFEQMAGYSNYQGFNLSEGAAPERIRAAAITAEFLPLLGYKPVLGRNFLAEEELAGHDRVAIVSQGFWHRQFGAEASLVGKTLTLDGRAYTIVGVMPANFWFPNMSEDVWVPLSSDPVNDGGEDLTNRNSHWVKVIGRLKPAVKLAQAASDMQIIASRLQHEYPAANGTIGARVVPLKDEVVSETRPLLVLLLAAASAVLLVACTNVANLLLARAAGRKGEIALRRALGASKREIATQVICETIPVSLFGGLIGMALAFVTTRLVSASPRLDIPRLAQVKVDVTVLAFAFILSLLMAVIAATVPALRAARTDLYDAIKGGSRDLKVGAAWRAQAPMVICEVGLAAVLTIGAGLLLRSFFALLNVNPGFDTSNCLTAKIALPSSRYAGARQRSFFFEQLLTNLGAQEKIESAAEIDYLPFGDLHNSAPFMTAEGNATEPDIWKGPVSELRSVSPRFFRTMKIPLFIGRDFGAQDTADSQMVAIISKSLMRQFFPQETPIGKHLRSAEWPDRTIEIVGVVGDIKQWDLAEEGKPFVYVPLTQANRDTIFLVTRSVLPPSISAEAMRRAMPDNGLPLYDLATMDQRIEESLGLRRFDLYLIIIFAGLALLLATTGLYGVLSYTVGQRSYEIGIRMALGARPREVLGLVLRQGLFLMLCGVSVGVIAALALGQAMAGLLYGVRAYDLMTFLVTSALLVAAGLIASYKPASRAAQLDPWVALRHE